MNEITISYHLLIASIISLTLILVSLVFRKKMSSLMFFSIFSFLLIYFSIVTLALTTDIYYQQELIALDLNKDGVFSENERTEEQKKLNQKLISDVGRNFSFISGLFVAGFLSTIFFISGLFFKKIKNLQQSV